MALYAIGDLHLSFGSDKPMDVFGEGWSNYTGRISAGFQLLSPDDVCVICGDISWGMTLEESLDDFRFLAGLPGKKIILKGNHDYWWTTATKMKSYFKDNGIDQIDILYNNCFYYKDAAICGTRGWLVDGDMDDDQNAKIMARETGRLRASLEAAEGAAVKLCFFHYPPRFKSMACNELIAVLNEYGVKNCWYGHIHSHGHRYAVRGEVEGIFYNMISADFVDFTPQRIMN